MPPQTFERVILQALDVPDSNYETVIGTAELTGKESTGRHSHPGPESGYVLQGSGRIFVEGQPPLSLKAGQSYKLPSGAVHDVQSGADGVKVIVIWVVEKGKPFAKAAN